VQGLTLAILGRKISMEDNNTGQIFSLHASVVFPPFALKSILASSKKSGYP